jgi:hypothetical protein
MSAALSTTNTLTIAAFHTPLLDFYFLYTIEESARLEVSINFLFIKFKVLKKLFRMADETGSKEQEIVSDKEQSSETVMLTERTTEKSGKSAIDIPRVQRPRKRRSERMSSILSENKRSVLRVTGKKKVLETSDVFGHRKVKLFSMSTFIHFLIAIDWGGDSFCH